jgi:hypothetical protein
MNTRYYIPYFPSNPYGTEAPAKAMDAACAALEARLGGPWQVLTAKAAFEEAGGLHAHWRGLYPPALTRWAEAARDALDAAYLAEPPTQESIADIDLLNTACIDVIATARYAYKQHEWLDVFTAHFGMSDYCDSRNEAAAAGHRWLAIAAQACPIAAAEQEIRNRSHARQQLALPRDRTTFASASLPEATSPETHGVAACF